MPVSDMAGEIVAVGEDVKGWTVGERVSSNFAVDHIHGKVTAAIKASALGAPIDGVLTEYKAIPAHVSNPVYLASSSLRFARNDVDACIASTRLLFVSRSTSVTRRRRHSRAQRSPRTTPSSAATLY